MKNGNGLRALKIVLDRLIEMFLISVLLWAKSSIQCQSAIGARGGRKRGWKQEDKQYNYVTNRALSPESIILYFDWS